MPNRRIAQVRGRETILECRITAYPHAVNYWEKDFELGRHDRVTVVSAVMLGEGRPTGRELGASSH